MQHVNMGYRHEWTDQQWERIRNMLPHEYPKRGKQGCPAKYDNRSIINGILWIAGNGASWREVPERYRTWQAVYAGFRLWRQRGIFEYIFTALREAADMEHLLIESTFCKLYQSANCEKNGISGSWRIKRWQNYENSCYGRQAWGSCLLFAPQWQRP